MTPNPKDQRRPRALDLFAGAGGVSVGLHRAGFDMTGADLEPHRDYPFDLIVADAMTILKAPAVLDGFDLVSASPPCPRHSRITPKHRRLLHPDYIAEVRKLLRAWGGLYLIENVPGAPLDNPLRLCGSSFGLRVRRHRLFESNAPLMSMPCRHKAQGVPVGVYGDHADAAGAVPRPNGTSRGVKAASIADAQDALGIDWMTTWDDLTDAIPPAMAEFVGAQLIDHLATERAA